MPKNYKALAGWQNGGQMAVCRKLRHSVSFVHKAFNALRPLRTMAFFAFSLALLKRKGRGGSQRTPRARKFRAPKRILLHPFSISFADVLRSSPFSIFHSPLSIIHHQSSIIH